VQLRRGAKPGGAPLPPPPLLLRPIGALMAGCLVEALRRGSSAGRHARGWGKGREGIRLLRLRMRRTKGHAHALFPRLKRRKPEQRTAERCGGCACAATRVLLLRRRQWRQRRPRQGKAKGRRPAGAHSDPHRRGFCTRMQTDNAIRYTGNEQTHGRSDSRRAHRDGVQTLERM
jgi:hypothetical protein